MKNSVRLGEVVTELTKSSPKLGDLSWIESTLWSAMLDRLLAQLQDPTGTQMYITFNSYTFIVKSPCHMWHVDHHNIDLLYYVMYTEIYPVTQETG